MKRHLEQEIRVRGYPMNWLHLEPSLVIRVFDEEGSVVGNVMQRVLDGAVKRVHAYGLPSDRRQAFVGGLVRGFIERGWGAQVLDTATLAIKHFAKDENTWPQMERQREAAILTLGREVEPRVGFFYLRALLDRAVSHQLPFVLLTDYPMEVHAPRYPDLTGVIHNAQFNVLNCQINVDG
jgi:hypothetical protein